MLPTRLSAVQVSTALASLPGWHLTSDGLSLERTWVWGDFDAAMIFVNRVADVARELDHHPDLYNVYNRVRLLLTTHDAGGLTERDVAFAQRASALTD